jgi:uncharacterized membrane protein
MNNEIKKRSAIKSIWWRIFGVIILATITFLFTGSLITTGLVTVIHHATFLVVFYLHERIWLKMKKPEGLFARSLCKMFTYETVCGNLILGTITYLITGSWKAMTAITLTYIGIKHVVYIINEFVWKRIRWGIK